MGRIHQPSPVLLLLAAFSRDPQAFDWACSTAAATWGPVALVSNVFDFVETDYYEPTMGEKLKKIFFAFARTVDPAELASIKRQTNIWEEAYAGLVPGAAAGSPAARPLNLDPGYLTEAKLVLASTKDHAHRVYVGHGIYAEVTLHYQNGRWQSHRWTYPDYRRDDYHGFFTQCRNYFRRRAARGRPP
jgi:hypothetical protein